MTRVKFADVSSEDAAEMISEYSARIDAAKKNDLYGSIAAIQAIDKEFCVLGDGQTYSRRLRELAEWRPDLAGRIASALSGEPGEVDAMVLAHRAERARRAASE